MEIVKTMFAIYTSHVRHVLDIALLTFIIYKIYEILLKTQAMQFVKGALLLLIIYAIAFVLKLNTLLWLLNTIATGLVIGTAIIFQPELRKIFLTLGQNNWVRGNARSKHSHINAVLTAAEILSSKRRGMLVIFIRQNKLRDIIENPSATQLNAQISSSLLVTIFGHDTPLHDGALMIDNGQIVAAGCFLPLTKQQDISKAYGSRHRAALGMAEESDAIVLVVSEENGAISLAYDSKLYYNLSPEDIASELEYLLNIKNKAQPLTPPEGSSI